MIDALFCQPNYLAAKRMLDITALRQEAISSNLANLETPGYKRLDVDPGFEAELARALQAGDISAIQQARPSLAADPAAVSGRRDGNTVQLEQELMALSQNSVAHAVQTQLITGSLGKLRVAISGRPS
jgi:flagellar basal-body rod protein FlgB